METRATWKIAGWLASVLSLIWSVPAQGQTTFELARFGHPRDVPDWDSPLVTGIIEQIATTKQLPQDGGWPKLLAQAGREWSDVGEFAYWDYEPRTSDNRSPVWISLSQGVSIDPFLGAGYALGFTNPDVIGMYGWPAKWRPIVSPENYRKWTDAGVPYMLEAERVMPSIYLNDYVYQKDGIAQLMAAFEVTDKTLTEAKYAADRIEAITGKRPEIQPFVSFMWAGNGILRQAGFQGWLSRDALYGQLLALTRHDVKRAVMWVPPSYEWGFEHEALLKRWYHESGWEWPGEPAEPDDLLIGWHVGVGVGGAGEAPAHLARSVWNYNTGTWKESLNDLQVEVMARIGDDLDFVHFHHPHGLGPWYVWRCRDGAESSRMRYETAVLNPQAADLDGLVDLFSPLRVAFYFGSPRCTELCEGMDSDPDMCNSPEKYIGEALSHNPLYIAFDALAPQTIENGPWVSVKELVESSDVPLLVEANVPKAREDMADVGLWGMYRGWLQWQDADWPRPIDDFDWVNMDYSHAPRNVGRQGSPEAILWKWYSCFEPVPNRTAVSIPWTSFVREGYQIEVLRDHLIGLDVNPDDGLPLVDP